MTDEDTDDNDRMNRADRLREMREGRRRGGRRADDEDDESEADETEAAEPDESEPESEPADTDSATETDDEETNTRRDIASNIAGSGEDDQSDESHAETQADETDDEPSNPREEVTATITSREESTDDESSDATEPTPTDSEADRAVEESGFEFDDPQDKETAHDEKAEKPAADDASTEPQSGIAQEVSSADAASAIESLGSGGTFAIPDQATTVSEEDEQSTLEGAEQSIAAARAAASRGTTHVGARTRVLEFDLGDERFCLDIDYIEEIVELENMTRVPNSPSYVEGVVDLRGQVTTIINPKDALDVDESTDGELIIVFDSEEVGEQGHLGWVVDEVRQVTPVSDEEVNDSPDEDAEHINGIINREDEDDFVVWTTPELALNSS